MTVRDWLEQLANSHKSSDKDSKMMQSLLQKVGFPEAKVVLGIVYLEGKGRPESIHTIARELLTV